MKKAKKVNKKKPVEIQFDDSLNIDNALQDLTLEERIIIKDIFKKLVESEIIDLNDSDESYLEEIFYAVNLLIKERKKFLS